MSKPLIGYVFDAATVVGFLIGARHHVRTVWADWREGRA